MRNYAPSEAIVRLGRARAHLWMLICITCLDISLLFEIGAIVNHVLFYLRVIIHTVQYIKYYYMSNKLR